MFERYTEKARRMIFYARYEASQFGSHYIETEHLLLGLLREDKALTNRFISSHVSPVDLDNNIRTNLTVHEKIAKDVDLPLSNESKRGLAFAAEEAERLGHKHVGTEHLLMGLLRAEDCFAAQILQKSGLKLAEIQDEIARAPHPRITRSGAPYISDDPAWRLADEGVTLTRPETCVIDEQVEVGPGTVIEPYVQLLGRTRIGKDCRIRSFSVIENCTLGNGVLIRQHCVLEDSTISDAAQIGPFAHLRPGSEIGESAHVGNFVETKKARLGKGAKANHLTYLGDAEIGEGSNIGAGTITCNYDGVNKHKTTIGKGAFVGSDSTLVAPVTVGDGAYVGAGSCITKDVPADALAVSRVKQANIEGWAAARRAKRQSRS